MASICALDVEFSDKIDVLLKPPSPHEVQEYFDQLIRTRQCRGLRIKQEGEYGKGLNADGEFREGELVLKDPMLVGAQHSSNKVDCLVCSHCFCFIGSIELQIGRKLYLQDLGVSASQGCDLETHQHTSKQHRYDDSSDGEENSLMTDSENLGACTSSDQNDRIPLPKEVVESLLNGNLALPYSKQFSLPSVVSCPGGCGEAHYCSKLCADADWELFHSLLCTGEKSGSASREALLKFIQHANDTNDIFLPAAKAISFTILKYKKLKAAHLENQKQYSSQNGWEYYGFPLLLEAWKPISMGYKKR